MNKYAYGTGKRKTSIARVFLKPGSGLITINDSKTYLLSSIKHKNIIRDPLDVLNVDNKIDLKITVKGGGKTGQTEAIRHGISKALISLNKYDAKKEFLTKKKLKEFDLLTRDSRKVERKKIGYRKARKKEQYSKR